MALQPTHASHNGFKKGQSGNPAGRKKGVPTRTTQGKLSSLATDGGLMPLDFALRLLRDKNTPMAHKLWAAALAAPYIHRRQPQAIEQRDITREEETRNADTVREMERVLAGVARESKARVSNAVSTAAVPVAPPVAVDER